MLSLDVPYLRPGKMIGNSDPIDPGPENFTILQNTEECPVAQYIINEQRINKFVDRKGNKTKLGIHVETCEICTGLRADVEVAEPKVIVREVFDTVSKKEYQEVVKAYAELREKYETLKAIKATRGPVLFPHQKQVTKGSMQSKNLKYKDELLKKYELEIARLKDELWQVNHPLDACGGGS